MGCNELSENGFTDLVQHHLVVAEDPNVSHGTRSIDVEIHDTKQVIRTFHKTSLLLTAYPGYFDLSFQSSEPDPDIAVERMISLISSKNAPYDQDLESLRVSRLEQEPGIDEREYCTVLVFDELGRSAVKLSDTFVQLRIPSRVVLGDVFSLQALMGVAWRATGADKIHSADVPSVSPKIFAHGFNLSMYAEQMFQ